MASVAVMEIELAPIEKKVPSRPTPPPPPSFTIHRRNEPYSDINRHPLQETSHAPQQSTPRWTGYSSGYMSSVSHGNSPRTGSIPHPPKLQRESEGGELLSDYSTRREYSSIGYYQPCLHDDDIYSRLDHSPVSTHRRQTPSHLPPRPQIPPSPASTLTPSHQPHPQGTPPALTPPPARTNHVTTRSRQQHPSSDQFQSTPLHSKAMKRRSPLSRMLKQLEGLDRNVKKWIIKADQHLNRLEYEDAIAFLEATIIKTQTYPRLQVVLWEILGNTHMALSHCKKASICYLHHLAYCRARNDFKGMSRAECNLGIAYMKMGLLKLSGRCFLQYLKNCRSMQDEWGVQSACSNLGLLSKTLALKNYEDAMDKGDNETAITSLSSCLRRAVIFFKQHLEVVLAHGNIEKQGRAYGNIGSCYELLNEYSDAIFYHQKRLETARMLGDRYSESCTLCNIGNSLRAKGNLQEGLEYYHMNLEMALSVGDVMMEELTHMNLGITYQLLKEPENAISSYTMYLGMVVHSGDLWKQASGFGSLAKLYLETGQLTKAHEYYQNLVGVYKKLGDHAFMKSAQIYLKYVQRLMKQQKRGKGWGNHTSSRRGRHHTVSRASNFHREISSHSLSECNLVNRPRAFQQNKMSTWSTRSHPWVEPPRPSALPLDSFGPDPILVLADMPHSWKAGKNTSSSNYPFYSTTTLQSPHPPTEDHTLFHTPHHTHTSSLDSSVYTSSHCSGEYDHLTQSPLNHTPPSHTHTSSLDSSVYTSSYCSGEYDHLTQSPQGYLDHTQSSRSSEMVCNHGYLDNEDATPGGPSREDPPSEEEDDDDLNTSGRSTALPFLSYTSSINTSLDNKRKQLTEEEDDDDLTHEQNMRELHKAGLQLARAGLELAGYEGMDDLGIHEDVVDKEWKQWQLIKEEEEGSGFGSMISVAGIKFRRNHRHGYLRSTASDPNI